MSRFPLAASLALVWLYVGPGGCSVEPVEAQPTRASAAAPSDPPALAVQRPELVPAPSGEVDALVREAMNRAATDGRRLVVYVGAVWCEPCQAFHHAVERGELDLALAGVRFLEFDSDRDGARLQAAKYGGRYIPRFVLPEPDGNGSAQRIEGGIKGEGAVPHLMGRLVPLLAAADDSIP